MVTRRSQTRRMRLSRLTRRRLLLSLGIVGMVLTVTTPLWLAVPGAACGIVALVIEYRNSGPVAVPVTVPDWTREGNEWVFSVPYREHGRRSPQAAVGETRGGVWEEIECGVTATADHTVRGRPARRRSKPPTAHFAGNARSLRVAESAIAGR